VRLLHPSQILFPPWISFYKPVAGQGNHTRLTSTTLGSLNINSVIPKGAEMDSTIGVENPLHMLGSKDSSSHIEVMVASPTVAKVKPKGGLDKTVVLGDLVSAKATDDSLSRTADLSKENKR